MKLSKQITVSTQNILLFIIICLLFFITRNIINNSITKSSKINNQEFYIEDTLNVNKIILSNRNLDTIVFQRDKDYQTWYLNNNIQVSPSSMNLMLKTLKEMRVKSPISRAALKNVIKRMSTQNTKVQIYYKNKLSKTIFIGGETQDQLGTYMMLESAIEPYVIHIPGFNGYLSSRFSCKELFWRNRNVFDRRSGTLDIIFHDNNCLRELNNLNNIYCESFIYDNNDFKSKDILQRKPFLKIYFENNDKETKVFYGYRKNPVKKEKYKEHLYDRERFYGIWDTLSTNNPLMLIQYQQFERIVKNNTCDSDSLFRPWKYININ